MNLTEQFLKFALATGAQWVMYLLIFCSVVNLAIIIDRMFYFFKYRGDFADFIQKLTDRLNSKEPLEKIAAWCSGQNMLEASVAAVGLERGAGSEKAAEESMMATMIAARTRFERGIIILGTLGNNTPFIGLFGTIIGIMQAFHALSTATNSGPEVVMSSIAEALTATAIGILVAVPAVIAYNFFNRAIKKKMANSDTTARIILSHIDSKGSYSLIGEGK
ncbi:MAG: MotA/TolQ/ExbB proton channel family protein [Bdellovibrionota bacterium]